MHVLYVIDTWGLIGGTERYAAVSVPALVDRGHKVTILCREDQEPDFADVDVVELPALEGLAMPRWGRRELAAELRTVAPDVVFHSALRNVDAAEVLVETAPVVRYVHDHTLFCPGLNKYREDGETCRDPMGSVCLERYWLSGGCVCFKRGGHRNPVVDPLRDVQARWREIEIAQRSTRVLTNSRYMHAELLKVGFHPDQASVLYLFTRSNTPDQPVGTLDEATERFLTDGDEPVLFTPARLTLPDKGVDYLITALGQVRQPFRAVIAGAGPAAEWLQEKAAEDGVLDRVHFAGWQPSERVEALYTRSDVVVCPSVWDEPFGLVGLEAEAHGKPVVAFGVGGVPEWLDDEETGFLVARKDTAGMAAAIDRLLADPQLRRRLGERGREVVAERFGRELHLDGLEAALVGAA